MGVGQKQRFYNLWIGTLEASRNGLRLSFGASFFILSEFAANRRRASLPARTLYYDALGRLVSETHWENGTTGYAYDDNGNLTQKTDARGWVTNYSYDELNRPTGKSYQNDWRRHSCGNDDV